MFSTWFSLPPSAQLSAGAFLESAGSSWMRRRGQKGWGRRRQTRCRLSGAQVGRHSKRAGQSRDVSRWMGRRPSGRPWRGEQLYTRISSLSLPIYFCIHICAQPNALDGTERGVPRHLFATLPRILWAVLVAKINLSGVLEFSPGWLRTRATWTFSKVCKWLLLLRVLALSKVLCSCFNYLSSIKIPRPIQF